MRIVVLVKQVPDTYNPRALDIDLGVLDRREAELVVDEIDERALALALQLRDTHGGDVTALTMGPADASKALRRCLAAGADRAVHIVDDLLGGSDVVQTSAALAGALRGVEFDLIVAGNESTDGGSGAVPSMLAERLGVAQLTCLRAVTVDGGVVHGERLTEDGHLDAHASLPAVISVTEHVAEPRFPSLKGVFAAKRKPLTVLSVADLGIAREDLGGANSWSQVRSVTARPPRTAGTVVEDDGTAAVRLVDFLSTSKLI